MKIVCAWCEKEGKGGLLEIMTRDPKTGKKLPDDVVSHGICQTHLHTMIAKNSTYGKFPS